MVELRECGVCGFPDITSQKELEISLYYSPEEDKNRYLASEEAKKEPFKMISRWSLYPEYDRKNHEVGEYIVFGDDDEEVAYHYIEGSPIVARTPEGEVYWGQFVDIFDLRGRDENAVGHAFKNERRYNSLWRFSGNIAGYLVIKPHQSNMGHLRDINAPLDDRNWIFLPAFEIKTGETRSLCDMEPSTYQYPACLPLEIFTPEGFKVTMEKEHIAEVMNLKDRSTRDKYMREALEKFAHTAKN